MELAEIGTNTDHEKQRENCWDNLQRVPYLFLSKHTSLCNDFWASAVVLTDLLRVNYKIMLT